MAWTVRFTSAAEKQLSKLDRPVQRRIITFLEDIVQQPDPRDSGKALLGDVRTWRYRVGDYRIICDLIDRDLVIRGTCRPS